MQENASFTQGKIFGPLIKFAFPILGALILQAMYGAVDLLVVGQYGVPSDISAVATGSQLMHTITLVITALASAATIMLGQAIGAHEDQKIGDIIGNSICLFAIIAGVVTIFVPMFSHPLSSLMHAPEAAFDQTVKYIIVCAGGSIFIVAYNLLGSIFRGLGDSKTPLLAVAIACVSNIGLDLLFVAVFHLAAMGAALATVLAQAISVVICLYIIRKRGLLFPFGRKNVRFHKSLIARTLRLGAQYLKAYAIDTLLVSFLFCFLGYFNGCGCTTFVMIQGVVGAFCVRIPVAYFFSRAEVVSLFNIGLATPCSTVVQILMCVTFFALLSAKSARKAADFFAPVVKSALDTKKSF